MPNATTTIVIKTGTTFGARMLNNKVVVFELSVWEPKRFCF